MNNVAGAIHAAGSRPLKDFTWGEIVVNIINSLVDNPIPPVTIESTGKSIIKLLDNLSDREKNIILSYPISIIDENGEFVIDAPKEKRDPLSVTIISIVMIFIIISFVITYFQASIAYGIGGSLTDKLNAFIDAISQLLSMK